MPRHEPRAGDEPEVEAAGGLVWRHGEDGGIQILLAHRPRYDDWTLPKGKRDPGEEMVRTAHREVLEETGLDCELGVELPQVTYRDHKDRPKLVRYWAMTVMSGDFVANDEVDEVAWLPVAAARSKLTYPHDRAVVDAFVTTTAPGGAPEA